ncbi:hypothetical protein [Amaricoccus macauensis]|uniref:hypothetical protein n=1 Tax=Amaricoccus macauensis TaxID=57001 RepID=UPI003C7CF41E
MIRRLLCIGLLVGGAAALSACAEREDYAAELGFYQDDRLRWDISGSYPSFQECKEVAQARHEVYTRQEREFSWACLKRDPETGEFTNRYR